MRILILTPGIYPDRHSGLPKLIFNLAQELQKKNHEIVVLTRQYLKKDLPFEKFEGIDFIRIPIPKRGDTFHLFWPLVTALKSRRWQRKIKKKYGNFDIVWVHNPWWTLFRNPKSLWPKAKIIYDFHSDAYTEIVQNNGATLQARAMGRLYDKVAQYSMKKSDSIVVHSHYTRGKCLDLAGSVIENKICIVPGGANQKVYYPALGNEKTDLKKKNNLPLDRPVFITARGLKPRTGVDKLVEAASLLKKAQTPFFLTIIGRGIMQKTIEKKIQEFDLSDSIKLLSNLSEEKLAEYYRSSDVFVLPTQAAEGFGLATTEALSSGLIVLGTNNSATPEILNVYHPEWIINGADPEAIAKKMTQYCHHPESLSLTPEKIRNKTLENFSWPVAANRFLQAVGGSVQ